MSLSHPNGFSADVSRVKYPVYSFVDSIVPPALENLPVTTSPVLNPTNESIRKTFLVLPLPLMTLAEAPEDDTTGSPFKNELSTRFTVNLARSLSLLTVPYFPKS